MNTLKVVAGTILTVISGIILLTNLIKFTSGKEDVKTEYIIYSGAAVAIGITLIISANKSQDRQEYEEYKKMKEQERAVYYRYANAKGTPIEEYLMDDRTKLITYYDRMPDKYKRQLLERADTLYRRSENEKYLNQGK